MDEKHEDIGQKHKGQRVRLRFVATGSKDTGRTIQGSITNVYNAPEHLNNEPRFTFHEDGYAHPHEYTQRYWRVIVD